MIYIILWNNIIPIFINTYQKVSEMCWTTVPNNSRQHDITTSISPVSLQKDPPGGKCGRCSRIVAVRQHFRGGSLESIEIKLQPYWIQLQSSCFVLFCLREQYRNPETASDAMRPCRLQLQSRNCIGCWFYVLYSHRYHLILVVTYWSIFFTFDPNWTDLCSLCCFSQIIFSAFSKKIYVLF